MKTLAIVLLLAVSSFAQSLESFRYVGRSATSAYAVGNVRRNGMNIRFTGMMTPFFAVDGKLVVDKDNVLFTEFAANCLSFEWYAISYRGVVKGEKKKGLEKPDKLVAEPGQIMFSALELACQENKLSA